MSRIDWKYPLMWGMDLKSTYKSIWLGWWLVTWRIGNRDRDLIKDFSIRFQPGL